MSSKAPVHCAHKMAAGIVRRKDSVISSALRPWRRPLRKTPAATHTHSMATCILCPTTRAPDSHKIEVPKTAQPQIKDSGRFLFGEKDRQLLGIYPRYVRGRQLRYRVITYQVNPQLMRCWICRGGRGKSPFDGDFHTRCHRLVHGNHIECPDSHSSARNSASPSAAVFLVCFLS